ncbi:hypothetical protein GO613_22775 [Azoarcus communis]|uniref:hypothetical protein n=1 Tax=Parazoarcus communis TaxID=41977 RepID=UPI0014599AD8|nr:hypothetical protein [Parazoarcus communis]NMG50922.1 hypothetical protein [Parazoarcus communis]
MAETRSKLSRRILTKKSIFDRWWRTDVADIAGFICWFLFGKLVVVLSWCLLSEAEFLLAIAAVTSDAGDTTSLLTN